MTRETKEIYGYPAYRRYALYNFGLDDVEKEIADARPVIDTFDPYEISEQVCGREEDYENWCVEYYWADENGEFITGSYFDTATAHYSNYHIKEGGKI